MEIIYRVEGLKKRYPLRRAGWLPGKKRYFNAVDGVDFEVRRGETFGIVGESGCGKTTLARLMLRLIEPTEGKLYFKGLDITDLSWKALKHLRRKIQMIFQDPFGSLDPKKSVFQIIEEPLKVHRLYGRKGRMEKVRETLGLVNLPDSDDFLLKYPDELSGGQRQRIGISRALVLGAEFLIGDEPVSMLDASVKADIIDLMVGLKEKIGLTYVFITHEIALAYHICDRIAVMYRGRIAELGNAEEVIRNPLHPYTRLLMAAIPPLRPDRAWGEDLPRSGEPVPDEDTPGCSFAGRCPEAVDECRNTSPKFQQIERGHSVACHLY